MNKRTLIFLLALPALLLMGCKTQNKATAPKSGGPQKIVIGDNSANALDWPGVYSGLLPCADCEGLLTTITLNKDKTFKRVTTYKGKDSLPFEESGKFNWDNTGSIIMLQGITNAPSYYQVGENQLVQLDMQGKKIDGKLADLYILKKTIPQMDASSIVGKKWKLVEINGKPVLNTSDSGKDYFIQLQQEETRLNGYAGCNNFFGSYELKEGNRVTFSKMGSTMMACPNMATEQELFKVLETVDNYTTDGKSLQLNKARMAPMARFEMISE